MALINNAFANARVFTGLRPFRNNAAVDVSREEEDGGDASVATSIRDQPGIRHGSACRLLPAS